MNKFLPIILFFSFFLIISPIFGDWKNKKETTTTSPIFFEEINEIKDDPNIYAHSKIKIMRGNLQKLKKLFMKVLFLGQQKRYELKLDEGENDYEMMEGIFIIIHCPISNVNNPIFWYKNGILMKNDNFNQWRFSISMDDYSLLIQPLIKIEDNGIYECKCNGSVISRAKFIILDQHEAYIKGLLSYLFTVLFVTPIIISAIIYRYFKPEIKESELEIKKKNNLTLFYEEMLLNREKKHDILLTKKMKEAVNVYKNKTVQKKMNSFRQVGLIEDEKNNNDKEIQRSMRKVLKNVTKIAEQRTFEYNEKVLIRNRNNIRKRNVKEKDSLLNMDKVLNV
ncbi:Immunoglobulin-like domain and Immunoglobulin-like fold domain-containing protein [Strongyloides ratti]|uniref:Immunoglobulin-like domain and Immunoglobulin-like fold domain-containing protein n=1 Tax=Strongyloides ratti TaxID=34506 RepID=A0A090L631_STRRB|nr:Immunoglobulin-like domain and Immunoglobulin-like fold domain-containing protein [Strongyloides ratti]CEF65226.1 Immunoglobulin-like domain and Immunoglobulin-like fold domain-containing protein [Strongyloides ratti]